MTSMHEFPCNFWLAAGRKTCFKAEKRTQSDKIKSTFQFLCVFLSTVSKKTFDDFFLEILQKNSLYNWRWREKHVYTLSFHLTPKSSQSHYFYQRYWVTCLYWYLQSNTALQTIFLNILTFNHLGILVTIPDSPDSP